MTGVVADSICKEHDAGPGHPERPARFDAVVDGLKQARLWTRLVTIEARDATGAELHRCHESGYLSRVEREIRSGHAALSTGDTQVCEKSWDVAVRAAGGVLNAVDAVMSGRVDNAFCVVRPPGHHATADRGMGFCILNNVALAARHAQHQHGAARVLIVDWDVHHGNGTQDIFFDDSSVLFFSTHQHPLYPGSGGASEIGRGRGSGFTINAPLPAGSGRREIFEAFERLLLPAARAFRPNIVLISAGFDSRAGDPLGDFRLDDDDFADLTRLLMEFARECRAPIVSVLEGGYDLAGLASAASAHVGALAEC